MSAAERLDELLADRALVGLDAGEAAELEGLQLELGRAADDSLEHAAAALDLALSAGRREELPPALARRLRSAGRAWVAGREQTAPVSGGPVPEPASRAGSPTMSAPAAGPRSAAAWIAALAAALVALVGWWPRLAGGPGDAPSTPAEARARLASRPGALELPWTATELGAGASGDVLWSQDEQAGYLRIVGLAPNDASVEQYQLWIFDEGREHPVDGGVFDVEAGEVLVPIDAKLRVSRPTLFAVTVERPGGVVVSDQQRIALVAEV